MNPLENCALLLGLPIGLLLAGYWLASRLVQAEASERIAAGILTGLAVLLWNVATVNFFVPLAGAWAWLSLWPILATVVSSHSRRTLRHDLSAVFLRPRGALVAALVAAFLVLLLWPLLTRSSLVFYDGTSNHDAFFWISAAEHLKRHTYMEMPVTSAIHPLTNATPAIIGWQAPWGRMGAEGLLALTSSIVGLAPLKLYLAATATLFVPWLAAVFLVVRTFLVGRLGLLAIVALVVLEPVFVFFHGNANLPNLVGVLMAALLVVATERSLRAASDQMPWRILLALGLHGLLCSYPEMLPFVALPAGLLWLRNWTRRGVPGKARRAWLALAFVAFGLLLNPASTVRAFGGFIASFDTARANQNWANLFEPLSVPEYGPALATLAVGASKSLGSVAGALLTIALIVGVVLALRRAVDRSGALFTLAGAGALLAYTAYTGFNYGWQKTVQFGGAFWVAFLPVALVDALVHTTPTRRWARLLVRGSLVGIIGLFAFATALNCLDGHKWSQRKVLTQDWFTVREFARERLHNAPVLVDGASFRMAFFHGMWATYFLSDSELYFAARGRENGGYLRGGVLNEARDKIPTPAAVLVSRDWADAFDANSPKLIVGDTLALVHPANRVMAWEGFYPDNGVPENAESHVTLDVRPHARSELQLTITPRYPAPGSTDHWHITSTRDSADAISLVVSGPPPWKLRVPLVAGKMNHLEFDALPAPRPESLPPFIVRDVKIVSLLK